MDMKKVLFLVLLSGLCSAQYNVRSPYLLQPEKAIGYVDSCARFWNKAYDNSLGGFYTNVDKYGNVTGTNKNTLSQSRDTYGYVRAFMLTGNESYLGYARGALNFMYSHAWDKSYGGWFTNLDKNGNPVNSKETKDAFNQHYALLGITAYFEATGDTMDWSRLMKGYVNNEQKLWDRRPGYEGYYDNASYNWTSKSGKSFNATVDAITTHTLYLYLLTGDAQYKDKLLKITDNMTEHLAGSMDSQKIGFVEEFDSDWNPDNNETMTIMGHVLKTAWCLGRVYQISPDTMFITTAKKLIKSVLDKGYDHQYGGPYKDFDRTTGQMLMWGVSDTAKAWWQMEQAVTAGLELYDITKSDEYLKMADESLDFFMKYFVDHENGEVYSDRTRDGRKVPQWGEEKGNSGKAAYHSTELGYYTYLYGNLFYKKAPVSLYYYFKSDSADRSVFLYPLAIQDNRLKIKDVTLNGEAFNSFNSSTRTIRIPAGKGGKFRVTFELNDVTSAASNNGQKPENFSLGQNYPNPFNPITRIRYSVGEAGSHVSLKVYDVLGSVAATLVDEVKDKGSYEVAFDASRLSSGIYFYRLQSGKNVISRKMTLLK
jgi:mannose/cellobiose epimerase-like protein (N-acyl-D-glucosamine 2-epimerase family)